MRFLMLIKKNSKSSALGRLLIRLSPRRIGKALYILFNEGPRALVQKSLKANYIDLDFQAFKKAADFGFFLSYSPEYESEAARLISEFLNFGLELKISDKKDENGVSILLFPDGSEKPEGIYIVVNKKCVEDMDNNYLLLLKSAYEVLDKEVENFSVWEKRTLLSRLPYFLPESYDRDFYLAS